MLTIGIDFDNTLVDYNQAFYHLAIEKKLIPNNFAKNKLMIRDYLRNVGKESEWTIMQGEVYGSRMNEAVLYVGAKKFITDMQKLGHHILIISHKTKHPLLGKKYDLHKAAFEFVKKNISIVSDHLYFELTRKEKINRIVECECDFFIDDLPEIFEDPAFPDSTKKILFDCDHHHQNINSSVTVCGSWGEVTLCFHP